MHGLPTPSPGRLLFPLLLMLVLGAVHGSAERALALTGGPYAYVANQSGTVSVINTSTNLVVATVGVGTTPTAVAITPDGSRVFVSNSSDNTVSAINTGTNAVIATIPVGNDPYGVAVTPDGLRVYVANLNDNTVSVIAALTNLVTATVPVGASPNGVAVTPDGSRVYVANYNSQTLSVIATATNTVLASVALSNNPLGVAVTPDGSRVYVTNAQGNVSVIATSSDTVVTTVAVGSGPFGVAVTPDNSRVYVTNEFSNTVSVLTTSTNAVLTTVPVGSDPVGIAVTPDGSNVYVANEGGTTVSVIATSTNTVLTAVTVGVGPNSLGMFIGPKIPAGTTSLLTSSPTPSSVSQPVTFTDVVSCGGATATGLVTFKDGSTTLAVIPLSGGTASDTTAALSSGAHAISASYVDDANCAGSVSNTVIQQVNPAGTGIALSASTNPATAGEQVTFTAVITCAGFTATGVVSFSDGSTALAGVALNGGRANFSSASLAVGSHVITASYAGDGNCAAGVATVQFQVSGGGVALPTTPLLVVGVTGCGSVSPASLPPTLGVGTTVEFTALPCPDHTFLGWTGGACDGRTDNPCQLLIETGVLSPMTANFSP